MLIPLRRILQGSFVKTAINAQLNGRIALPCSAAGVYYNLTSATSKLKDVPLRSYASAPKKQNLLRYPALPFDETIKKFIKSAEPFLSEEELEIACKEIEVFSKCSGRKLQTLLEKAASKNENWWSDRWLRVAYLGYRDPLVAYSSPAMLFPTAKFEDQQALLCYTASVIYCLIKYKQIIDAGKIPIQKIGKHELDNGQFGKVLGTCRIPNPEVDKIQYYPKSKHVVVIYRNHFYKLPVYSKTNKPLHRSVICDELQKICSAEKKDGIPFGILTTDKRDNWAGAYKELISIKENKKSVEEIQKSLITVSLDGELCYDSKTDIKTIAGELVLHGCGSSNYGGNRWFDKTIQLVVCQSGFTGFAYEHSPAEGQPIALMTDYLIKNIDNADLLEGAECDNFEPAKKLPLKTSPALDKHISVAKTNLDKLIDNLHMNVLHFKAYGKGFLKKQKLSPDSFIQMALQYAFYKLHKVPGAAYESAHLRVFSNGRTETIRSCSNESMAFARAMYEPNSDELRVDLLRKAVNSHREYTAMALMGKGVDRHLLALKLMAIENKLPVPDFYSTAAFQRSGHFRLSTSQVASVNEAFMCYGAPNEDAYACCYNPRENDMILALSSWRSCADTCSDRFANSLTEALCEMQDILNRAGAKPKSKL